jgi:hypothetical protein
MILRDGMRPVLVGSIVGASPAYAVTGLIHRCCSASRHRPPTYLLTFAILAAALRVRRTSFESHPVDPLFRSESIKRDRMPDSVYRAPPSILRTSACLEGHIGLHAGVRYRPTHLRADRHDAGPNGERKSSSSSIGGPVRTLAETLSSASAKTPVAFNSCSVGCLTLPNVPQNVIGE